MFTAIKYSAIPLLVTLSACSASTPSSLVDARAAYQRASNGPAARLSPAQLHVAETSLAIAEQTYEDEGDSANARDRAYVAERKAQLAETQARIASADLRFAAFTRETARAKERNQAATRRDLDDTKAQLAGEKTLVASQSAELNAEKNRRFAAEQSAASALAALANVAPVTQESRGTVITLSGAVIFASGRAELLPGARNKLDQVATALAQAGQSGKIVVEGHTDSRGSASMNEELSQRRAAAVRDYLISKGVSADRMEAQGMGPSRPIADNDTAEGRANNRRVEIV
ncbi:MAG TPA: OmpA family protein, partial [Polyangiaceae bacterium]|nr:OmpA family protein [Polyangiaceae bacterium]